MKLLTLARDLRRRKARERERMFVAEGVRAVEELLDSELRVKGVLVAPQLCGASRGVALRERLEAAAGPRDFGLVEVSEQEFRSAAETESPQGVLALAEAPERSFEKLTADLARLLVLDAVQDPGNVGTILRTAAALGVGATVALPGTVDIWNAKVVRGAMGAHFRHAAFAASVEELRGFLDESGMPLWAAEAEGELLSGQSRPDRLAVAVGNEGGGLTPAVSAMAARTVAIPVAASVDSLNVAVATGIILYETRP